MRLVNYLEKYRSLSEALGTEVSFSLCFFCRMIPYGSAKAGKKCIEYNSQQ